MRYLGGKSKIAKRLAAVIRKNTSAQELWEPFCGGMNATHSLSVSGFRVWCSDENTALIALFRAWREGWRPPARSQITREGHKAARDLPDTNPLKAFYGYGLSFGGDYFCGFTGAQGLRPSDDYYGAAMRSLTRDTASAADVWCQSFFEEIPDARMAERWAIYCDPPYAGTTGYRQGSFDHEAFWRRCREWAAVGVPVFVSEYSAPAGYAPIATFTKRVTVSSSSNTAQAEDNLYLLQANG